MNGAVHTGLALVLWTGFASKTYMFPLVKPIPLALRMGIAVAVPPLLAYLRFQDIFYESELVSIAKEWEKQSLIHSGER